jgi:hypothetical protein
MPKSSKTPRTTVRILEAPNETGLTVAQKRIIDQSQYLVIQAPTLDYETQTIIEAIRKRAISTNVIPSDFPATQKDILNALYKRKSKPVHVAGIETNAYNFHKSQTLDKSMESFLEAENHFYFGSLQDAITEGKKAYDDLARFKQGIESQVVNDLADTSKTFNENPSSVCYLTQASTPQVADALYAIFNNVEGIQCNYMSPFTMDFLTETYRDHVRKKKTTEGFELSDVDYLRMVLFQSLLNLGINESDIPKQNFRLEQHWLNVSRNAIIQSFSLSDIQQLHKQIQTEWFGWDKSKIIVENFRSRMPQNPKSRFQHASKYLSTGFNLIRDTKTDFDN